MAGKRDEVFLLGEEEVGDDLLSAPAEEQSASAPVPGSSRSTPRRVSWPLILAAAVLLGAIALLSRPGEEGAAPAPRRAERPALTTTPEVVPIARAPREADRRHRAPERRPRRPRPGAGGEGSEEPAPAPLAETASAPPTTYVPAPELAPQPAPEDTAAAPAPAAPLPAARPEFGIER